MKRPTLKGLNPPLEINTIFCIGRNYAEHARELNNEVPGEPVVFLKPVTSVTCDGSAILLPAQSSEVHHEVELVAAIGRKGRAIPEERALEYVAGYGIGIDVTARDLQRKAKQDRTPWTVAKGFDTFAPISSFLPADKIGDPQNLELILEVNGTIRQQESTRLMIFPVKRLISYLSSLFTLHPGDIIFTGTPAGVAPLQEGDTVRAFLGDRLLSLTLNVTRQP